MRQLPKKRELTLPAVGGPRASVEQPVAAACWQDLPTISGCLLQRTSDSVYLV
jgi:hypothetical protein